MPHVSDLRIFSSLVQHSSVQGQMVNRNLLINVHDLFHCTLLAKAGEGLCSLLSPSVVQWEAMTFFMEGTVASILKCLEEEVREAMQRSKKYVWGCLLTVLLMFSFSLRPSELQQLPIDQSMELLQAVLSYNTKDPLISSCVLTNISTLFPFAVHRPHFLPRIIYKVS